MSTPVYGVLYPAMLRHGRTFAKREKVRRRVKFNETWPFPIGVARGPLRAMVFFLTIRWLELFDGGLLEAIASSGIAVFPSLRMGVTSTGSHMIGVYTSSEICIRALTFAAAKIAFTLSEISGPIPSPGIKVTV